MYSDGGGRNISFINIFVYVYICVCEKYMKNIYSL